MAMVPTRREHGTCVTLDAHVYDYSALEQECGIMKRMPSTSMSTVSQKWHSKSTASHLPYAVS